MYSEERKDKFKGKDYLEIKTTESGYQWIKS